MTTIITTTTTTDTLPAISRDESIDLDSLELQLLLQGEDDNESIASWSTLVSGLKDDVADDLAERMAVYNQFFDVGTRVEYFFPCDGDENVLQLYYGEVVSFDAEYGWYLVRFEDDDEEEFTQYQIPHMLRDI